MATYRFLPCLPKLNLMKCMCPYRHQLNEDRCDRICPPTVCPLSVKGTPHRKGSWPALRTLPNIRRWEDENAPFCGGIFSRTIDSGEGKEGLFCHWKLLHICNEYNHELVRWICGRVVLTAVWKSREMERKEKKWMGASGVDYDSHVSLFL